MILSAPVQKVVDVLTGSGYQPRQSPLIVASVPFEFTAMLLGSTRSLDLIVVVDTLIENDIRVRQKVEGLSRALDLASSRRPLTIVLVGPLPSPAVMDSLTRVSRVLPVGTPTGETALEFLRDALAVLLPLEIPATSETVLDPLGTVREAFAASGGVVSRDVEALIDASVRGADSVRERFREQLIAAIVQDSMGDLA